MHTAASKLRERGALCPRGQVAVHPRGPRRLALPCPALPCLSLSLSGTWTRQSPAALPTPGPPEALCRTRLCRPWAYGAGASAHVYGGRQVPEAALGSVLRRLARKHANLTTRPADMLELARQTHGLPVQTA